MVDETGSTDGRGTVILVLKDEMYLTELAKPVGIKQMVAKIPDDDPIYVVALDDVPSRDLTDVLQRGLGFAPIEQPDPISGQSVTGPAGSPAPGTGVPAATFSGPSAGGSQGTVIARAGAGQQQGTATTQTTQTRPAASGSRGTAERAQSAAVRRWATDTGVQHNGKPIGDRGRLPEPVINLYFEHHPNETRII